MYELSNNIVLEFILFMKPWHDNKFSNKYGIPINTYDT